ncbi:hypothetical protein LOC67_20035 [Stieleria sp. JC731]|nr:hypothetical protein [Stieleria sp. JC731]MCC9602847.1 hypothetical protein [Stieleria sp. JC731]
MTAAAYAQDLPAISTTPPAPSVAAPSVAVPNIPEADDATEGIAQPVLPAEPAEAESSNELRPSDESTVPKPSLPESSDSVMELADFLDRETLPKGTDGEQLKCWPMDTIKDVLRGKIKLALPTPTVSAAFGQFPQNPYAALPASNATKNRLTIGNSADQIRMQLAPQIESRIQQMQKALVDASEDKEKSVSSVGAIAELKFLYQLRFDLDTAFQDLKVTEIEARAKKLREEVERREASVDKWVDAKITLDQMKADGIDVNQRFSYPSAISIPQPAQYPPPIPAATFQSFQPALPTTQFRKQ